MSVRTLIVVIVAANLITNFVQTTLTVLAKEYLRWYNDYRFHRRLRSEKWEIRGGRWVKRTNVQR